MKHGSHWGKNSVYVKRKNLLLITPTGWRQTATNLPSVSLIVPVKNEALYLERCLENIFRQSYPEQLIDVWVVDGNSSDNSRQIVLLWQKTHPNLHLLANPAGDVAAAMNRGLVAARGEIVLRVDGHAFIAPDYVAQAVQTLLAHERAASVGGGFRPIGEGVVGEAIAGVIRHPLGGGPATFRHADIAQVVDTVYLGAWWRTKLIAAGGFDPALHANEDYELHYRLRQQGGEVVFNPAIRSHTVTRSRFFPLAKQYLRYGFWKAHMLAQHPASVRPRQIAPPLLPLLVLLLLAFNGWPRFVATILLGGYFLLMVAAATELALTYRLKSWLYYLVAFLVVHWSWGTGFWAGSLVTTLSRYPRPYFASDSARRKAEHG